MDETSSRYEVHHRVSEEYVKYLTSGVLKREFELDVPEASEDSETTEEGIEGQNGDPKHVKVLRNVRRHAKRKIPQDNNIPFTKES